MRRLMGFAHSITMHLFIYRTNTLWAPRVYQAWSETVMIQCEQDRLHPDFLSTARRQVNGTYLLVVEMDMKATNN